MAYYAPYIDTTGIHVPTYEDIRDDLIASMKQIFGQDIYLADDSQDYQQICIFAKKIFAFVDFVYQSSKAKPFMKLASEIFDKEFLDYGREILFNNEKIWKQVYEISTIGHEFGHILFMDSDSENLMNIGGEFKFIEEYKATTGGLINFFLHVL